jgi:UMF1 family MFS transporter
MLLAFSLLGIATTLPSTSLPRPMVAAAALFTLGTLGFNGGIVFYDALLLDVAKPEDLDRVSAQGYALGYLGGGLLFALNVLMVVRPGWFGLPDAAEAVRWSFVTVAVWWLVFLVPLMLYVRESPPTASGAAPAPGPPAGANWPLRRGSCARTRCCCSS